MSILKNSTFTPSILFKLKHFNTVYRPFFDHIKVNYHRERIELEDGDFIDLDTSSVNADKVVIAIHGLEGSSQSKYILALTTVLNQHNFDVFAFNLRGCSGEINRLISSYHSGKTEDLEHIVKHIQNKYSYNEIHIIGYSLGGNLTLKYMGEIGNSSTIKSAIGVSVPCDLKATAIKMNTISNRFYLKMFLKSLKQKSYQKLEKFPSSFLTKESIGSIHNFKDFDDIYTAPAHGFIDAEDYWKKSSCKQYIPHIKIPTLLITSIDDPFLSKACYPIKEAKENNAFYLETPDYGGHVGFISSFSSKRWLEYRILEFLKNQE